MWLPSCKGNDDFPLCLPLQCTVSSANGITKTQVYYPRPRSFSTGSQGSALTTNKRLSVPLTTTTTPTSAVKVVRINTSKMYGKAKSLEEGKPLSSPTSGGSTMRYKTELCRPFLENGFCKYGDKCQFAHGEPDLRCLPRHPKYKTELCRTYHTRGFCPYGMRCHFIHSVDETRKDSDSAMPPKSPTKRSFSFSMPLSPSLDSGISSPDDYQRGKYFDFPVTDHSSGSGSDGEFRDFEHSFDQDLVCGGPSYAGQQESIVTPDPFQELDTNSIGSESPLKKIPDEVQEDVVYSMQELITQMSLDESSASPGGSCHRLPVFDDMLNTKSNSALLEQNLKQSPVNTFGLFGGVAT